MKTIYLDTDFKCHVNYEEGMTAFETDFFDDKCNTFIEGYRIVPEENSWTRNDGKVFVGEMITPCRNYNELKIAQEEYENIQLILSSSYQEGVNSI